jgi:hypothetical protein
MVVWLLLHLVSGCVRMEIFWNMGLVNEFQEKIVSEKVFVKMYEKIYEDACFPRFPEEPIYVNLMKASVLSTWIGPSSFSSSPSGAIAWTLIL